MKKTMWMMALAGGLLLPLASGQAVETEAERAELAAEDAEVLRRILRKRIDNVLAVFRDSTTVRQRLRVDPAPGTTQGASIFLDPNGQWGAQYGVGQSVAYFGDGLGAVVNLDVKVPTKSVDADTLRATEKEPDPWEEARRELKSGRSLYGLTTKKVQEDTAKAVILDPEAMAEVEDVIVSTLASLGSRLESLRPEERIVVAVRFQGAKGLAYAGGLVGAFYGQQQGVSGRRLTGKRLVAHVAKSACDAYSGGRRELEDIRRAVRVTRY